MIALDTNILVYARRQETPHHAAALTLLRRFADGSTPWAIPWPWIYEFLRVVTHPRIFDPPSDLEVAIEDLEQLLDSPTLHLLGEGPTHPARMRHALRSGKATGNLAHDAHIAALVAEHGVREIWTTDRDFARFKGIKAKNPFTEFDVGEPSRAGRARAKRRR